MTIANYCVLTACLLPIATIGLAKAASAQRAGMNTKDGYDNREPRQWAESLSGWQRRAHAAQLNGFEALPLFIAAVVLAQQAHAAQSWIDGLALGFIVFRLLYVAAYLVGWNLVRTAMFVCALGLAVWILALAM